MSLSEERACRRWASETFGGFDCGDRRRSRRAVRIGARLARRPGATITEVFKDSAEREGAYRWLSNEAVVATELIGAVGEATAGQCAAQDRTYVAVDGSSLLLTDRKQARGLGAVGTWKDCGRGLQVLTAMALDPQGVPIGLLAQTWWPRLQRSPDQRCSRRKLDDKETRFQVQTVQDALGRLRERAPQTLAIAVCDRGFDCWPVLRLASQGAHFIVRAKANRRLLDGPGFHRRYLHPYLDSQPIRGRYDLYVPQRPSHPARMASMRLRAVAVQVELRVGKKRREYVTLNAVLAREVGGPRGQALSWMLLTTEPIDTIEQIAQIVRAYAFRWRIEEVHRAWKRGNGYVEGTQLRSREAITKWATIHCAVAIRAVRIAQRARSHPDLPATEEFTDDEIEAAILLWGDSKAWGDRLDIRLGQVPSLAHFTRLVAYLGGYTGPKSSGGPPGPTVIGRGLQRVVDGGQLLDALRNAKRAKKK
jgi:hypothetical protein